MFGDLGVHISLESEILWCVVVRTGYWSTTQQDPNNRMSHCPKSHLSFSMDPKSLVVRHLKREVVILSVPLILFLGTRARSSRPPSGLLEQLETDICVGVPAESCPGWDPESGTERHQNGSFGWLETEKGAKGN